MWKEAWSSRTTQAAEVTGCKQKLKLCSLSDANGFCAIVLFPMVSCMKSNTSIDYQPHGSLIAPLIVLHVSLREFLLILY